MRCPVEDHETAAPDHLAGIIKSQPTHVAPGLQLLLHPGLETLCHHIEDAVVSAACIHKHAPAVVGDDSGVSGRGGAGSEHACEYRAELPALVH